MSSTELPSVMTTSVFGLLFAELSRKSVLPANHRALPVLEPPLGFKPAPKAKAFLTCSLLLYLKIQDEGKRVQHLNNHMVPINIKL